MYIHVDLLLFYGMFAYWICPCSYGIYCGVASAQPMVEEVIFTADFQADHFDHPELRQLAKALPAVLVCYCTASTVVTYLHANKCWKSWASRHDAASLQPDSVVLMLHLC